MYKASKTCKTDSVRASFTIQNIDLLKFSRQSMFDDKCVAMADVPVLLLLVYVVLHDSPVAELSSPHTDRRIGT